MGTGLSTHDAADLWIGPNSKVPVKNMKTGDPIYPMPQRKFSPSGDYDHDPRNYQKGKPSKDPDAHDSGFDGGEYGESGKKKKKLKEADIYTGKLKPDTTTGAAGIAGKYGTQSGFGDGGKNWRTNFGDDKSIYKGKYNPNPSTGIDKFRPDNPGPPSGKTDNPNKYEVNPYHDYDDTVGESGKKKKKMTENIEKASKLREVFPKGRKPTKGKDKPISIGQEGKFGHSLTKNDPETLKFIDRHPVKDHGDIEDTGAFNVATSYSLDNPKNSRLKGHGKDKERKVYESKEEGGVCPKCHKAPCKCGGVDKSEKEPAYQKDKKLLLGGKKLREDTLANRLAMEILEYRKIERLDEAQNLNPYATEKIGGGGMGGGGFAPKASSASKVDTRAQARSDAFAAFDKRNPSQNQSIWQRLTGQSPTADQTMAANANRAAAHTAVKQAKDTIPEPYPESGKGIGKGIHKIDMGNPKFPKLAKGKLKNEEVKLSNQHDTHDTEFTAGMEVHKKGEGEIQTHTKPAGPTASGKSKKLDKRDTKGDPRSFKEGAQPDPQTTQVEEEDKMHKTMHEFKYGKLHSGSKTGPTVKSRAQAIAIGLSQKRKAQHNEDAAEPLLGEGGKKRKKLKEGGAPADTPIAMPPGDKTQNLKADTGFALEGGRSPGTIKRMEHNVKHRAKRQNHFGQVDEGEVWQG
jgi:hypothetical protein